MKTREEIIHDMCMTWRHDFGLDKEDGVPGGLSDLERRVLWNSMAQVFDNTIAPNMEIKSDSRVD